MSARGGEEGGSKSSMELPRGNHGEIGGERHHGRYGEEGVTRVATGNVKGMPRVATGNVKEVRCAYETIAA